MGHDDPVSVQSVKAQMRATARARRATRSDLERRTAADSLADHGMTLLAGLPGAGPITAYLSMPAEPDADPLIARATAAGHRVHVPRIDGRALAWVAYAPGDAVRSGPLGIREPVGPAVDLDAVGLMFLPGLSVGADGCRLGQGGGYYDRALADVPPHAEGGPLLVIVLFADEIVDTVPAEGHDRRVDAALTPAGVVYF